MEEQVFNMNESFSADSASFEDVVSTEALEYKVNDDLVLGEIAAELGYKVNDDLVLGEIAAELNASDILLERINEEKDRLETVVNGGSFHDRYQMQLVKSKQKAINEDIQRVKDEINGYPLKSDELNKKIEFYDSLEKEIDVDIDQLKDEFKYSRFRLLTGNVILMQKKMEQVLDHAEVDKDEIDRKLKQRWRLFGKGKLRNKKTSLIALQIQCITIWQDLQQEATNIANFKLSTQ